MPQTAPQTAPPTAPAFGYRDNALHAEAVPVADIAARFGTPTYVYSRAALERNFGAYQTALAGADSLVCYAVKANSNLAVLGVLARLGAGFDVVSQGELLRVLAAGGDPRKVVYSGVAKGRDAMARALREGILCFNVESAAELEQLNAVAASEGETAPVSLRVNPNVDAGTHPYIATGLRESKFGIEMEQAFDAYLRAADLPHLSILGVDCHIGSQITATAPFIDALRGLLDLVDRLADAGIHLRHLDIGGGLGVRYRDEQPPSVAEYLGALRARLGERPLKLVVEPGRSIAAAAGVLLTRVELIKRNSARNFAIVDAAMNDMLRPALYQAWLDIWPARRATEAPLRRYDVVGPVCESGDFLGRDRDLAIAEGDLLAVMTAGAYGAVMGSNYNSRQRAAEVLVDGEHLHLARQREPIDAIMHSEIPLPAEEADYER